MSRKCLPLKVFFFFFFFFLDENASEIYIMRRFIIVQYDVIIAWLFEINRAEKFSVCVSDKYLLQFRKNTLS